MSTCQAHMFVCKLCAAALRSHVGLILPFMTSFYSSPSSTTAPYNPIPQWPVSKQSRQRRSCPRVPVHLVGVYVDDAPGRPEQSRESDLDSSIL